MSSTQKRVRQALRRSRREGASRYTTEKRMQLAATRNVRAPVTEESMTRPLHPLAVASLEAWLATLPEEVRFDERHGSWWRTDHVIGGVAGAVDLIRCNTTCGWHFDDCGPSLVRMLRRAALLDIAEHEPTEFDCIKESGRRFGEAARAEDPLLVCIARHGLTRRRHAALRLLMLDEHAMMTEGATYSDAGWATATLPAGSGAVHERLEYAAIGGAT